MCLRVCVECSGGWCVPRGLTMTGAMKTMFPEKIEMSRVLWWKLFCVLKLRLVCVCV